MEKIKVLLLASNPRGTAPLDLSREFREIDEEIRRSTFRDAVELVLVPGARPVDLLRKLNEMLPQVVHFSTHGSPDEILLEAEGGQDQASDLIGTGESSTTDRDMKTVGRKHFEGSGVSQGPPQPLNRSALVNVLRSCDEGNLRLVVLNACDTRPHAEALLEVVDCVVSMNRTITDWAAIKFAASFYGALGFGRSLQKAFDQGVARLRAEGIAEAGTPELLVRSGVDASRVVLVGPAIQGGPDAVHAAEHLWHSQGPEAAIREIERATDGADVSQLISILDLLAAMDHPGAIPLLFRFLAHAQEQVRTRAKKVVQTFGWERVTASVEDVARHDTDEHIGAVLDGLAAFEAHRQIVALLDRLVTLLKGDLRNRTILLLERKQQALDLERIVELFREARSPCQIQKVLGQGLSTAAYLARDESNELDVVVRVLRPELANLPQIRAQFLDLGRRSVKLVHHNLVLTREIRYFPDRHIYYVVRNYVDGITLQKLLVSGRVFSPDQIIKILSQVLQALTPIHVEGMAHGSIKPSNIFLCGEDRVILGDLGLSTRGISLHLDRLSYDYRYAPPEMFRQGGTLGPSSDLYSLGCVAYELACGNPPFISDNHFELAGKHDREAVELPSRLGSCLGPAGDALLLRLLAKSPSDRFADLEMALQSLDELRAALRPANKPDEPSVPILGEASLIRYATGALESAVSFTVDLRTAEDTIEIPAAHAISIGGAPPIEYEQLPTHASDDTESIGCV